MIKLNTKKNLAKTIAYPALSTPRWFSINLIAYISLTISINIWKETKSIKSDITKYLIKRIKKYDTP